MIDLAGRMTVGEILPIQALRAEFAGKPALYFDHQIYSYADLEAASARVAAQLRARTLGDGDTIALILPNAPALIAYLFGILRTGAICVPLNPDLTPRELSVLLQESAARAIVTTTDLAQRLESMHVERPELQHEITVDPSQPLDCTALDADAGVGGRPEQIAFLIFTSGTTGRPKGVMLSHRNVLANTAQVAERTGLTPADRVLHVMPLFHVNGLMNNTILPLRAGASIVLRPRFDLGEFWDVVESFRPTYFTAVPTVFSRLMDAWDGRAKTSSLRFVRTGAAPMALPCSARSRSGSVLPSWFPTDFPKQPARAR